MKMRFLIFVLIFFSSISEGMKSQIIALIDNNGFPVDCREEAHSLHQIFDSLQSQYHRCHAEIFLLKKIKQNSENLNGYTIIEQPYFPCATPFLGEYLNESNQTITEYNPGQTCDVWVQRFANQNRCTIVFQKPTIQGSKSKTYSPM